jgi:hypothetical protein
VKWYQIVALAILLALLAFVALVIHGLATSTDL